MNPQIADAVFPVFSYGIRLKESLKANEQADFATAQRELHGLLQAVARFDKFADFQVGQSIGVSVSPAKSTQYLGIGYALVCWLDEIFIFDSPWKSQWNEHKLEFDRYRTTDRAWKFWEQAKKAESQPTSDALETYWLAVMLGFRGDYEDSPDKLKSWIESAKALIDKGQPADWPGPVDTQPKTFVPPLTGARQLSRMVTIVGLAFLVLIPVAAYFVFNFLKRH
jgi:type VI protein secretion system component VasF